MARVKKTKRQSGTEPRKTIIQEVGGEDASRTILRTVSNKNSADEEASTRRRLSRLQTKKMVSTPESKTPKKRKSPLKEVS